MKKFLILIFVFMLTANLCGCKNQYAVDNFPSDSELFTESKNDEESDTSSQAAETESEPAQNLTVFVIVETTDSVKYSDLITFTEGDTVLDILTDWGKQKNVPVVFSGTGENRYVSGIDNLFELQMGSESGWVYRVNGELPTVGCASYKVSDTDKVEFIYITELSQLEQEEKEEEDKK